MSRFHFDSFAEIANYFEDVARASVPEALMGELEVLGGLIEDRAKSYIGHPQTQGHGGFPPWVPLAESTLERKGNNTPLLASGEMRDSIKHQLVSEVEVEIGTNDPKAKFHEHGTVNMPARPFLEPAAVEVTGEKLGAIGYAVVEGFMGGKSTSE